MSDSESVETINTGELFALPSDSGDSRSGDEVDGFGLGAGLDDFDLALPPTPSLVDAMRSAGIEPPSHVPPSPAPAQPLLDPAPAPVSAPPPASAPAPRPALTHAPAPALVPEPVPTHSLDFDSMAAAVAAVSAPLISVEPNAGDDSLQPELDETLPPMDDTLPPADDTDDDSLVLDDTLPPPALTSPLDVTLSPLSAVDDSLALDESLPPATPASDGSHGSAPLARNLVFMTPSTALQSEDLEPEPLAAPASKPQHSTTAAHDLSMSSSHASLDELAELYDVLDELRDGILTMVANEENVHGGKSGSKLRSAPSELARKLTRSRLLLERQEAANRELVGELMVMKARELARRRLAQVGLEPQEAVALLKAAHARAPSCGGQIETDDQLAAALDEWQRSLLREHTRIKWRAQEEYKKARARVRELRAALVREKRQSSNLAKALAAAQSSQESLTLLTLKQDKRDLMTAVGRLKDKLAAGRKQYDALTSKLSQHQAASKAAEKKARDALRRTRNQLSGQIRKLKAECEATKAAAAEAAAPSPAPASEIQSLRARLDVAEQRAGRAEAERSQLEACIVALQAQLDAARAVAGSSPEQQGGMTRSRSLSQSRSRSPPLSPPSTRAPSVLDISLSPSPPMTPRQKPAPPSSASGYVLSESDSDDGGAPMTRAPTTGGESGYVLSDSDSEPDGAPATEPAPAAAGNMSFALSDSDSM
ncbi:uncharacterized protein AMSG_04731 [Thecamonas trahens ATCC 50062]|uniref:Uncharacterized protein n=1 Tax=Thecamonas trahens ATCC 50062 TaxID=461836 RepID=A0A0L0D9D3_THETB|nr:hypothetical protein AMSG_04731 [Thecamonas trahens ATCC 50062]KNC48987.1 hypothetical protein AMSG_04731 [Thecamonas trahens ATCC 50062]|eukprot:XP_013758402.1 hypothetical protein AMSG_04731 [Thecamonas trahens ATCC 50062]